MRTLSALYLALALCALSCTQGAASQSSGNDEQLGELLSRAKGIQDWVIGIRRKLHQQPELMFEEKETSKLIQSTLKELKITFKHPYAKTGVVATIGSGSPVVALRADMDALPIEEELDLQYKSKSAGVMHACGHDGHVAMLLGAARLLSSLEADKSLPKGTVKLVFQPAEEGGAGADVMIKEGALDGVDAAFAMHVWPTVPSGKVASTPGTIMAGCYIFRALIKGRGGHGAMPHLATDPVVAASHAVSALQVLVSRETAPLASSVVSVTWIKAGEAYNVIPDDASFGGTIRSLTHEGILRLRERVDTVIKAQAQSLGCEAEVDWMEEDHPYYPPTVNSADAYRFATGVADRLLGEGTSVPTEPTMGAEDFSFITRKVPAAMLFLGIQNETAGSVHGLHTPRFTMDEGQLHRGAALHAALAVEFLSRFSAHTAGGWATAGSSSSSSSKDEL